jgi:hypothetical protein
VSSFVFVVFKVQPHVACPCRGARVTVTRRAVRRPYANFTEGHNARRGLRSLIYCEGSPGRRRHPVNDSVENRPGIRWCEVSYGRALLRRH